MKAQIHNVDRLVPRLQQNWDLRAALNFICGGMGGGLLFWAGLAALGGGEFRPLLLLGLALVGIGLTSVWFEIGRPWRALNVFRHAKSSWMTREAMVAMLLFALGLAALARPAPALFLLTGLVGGFFVYSQGRILRANKGIPAWRHPACLPLLVATGLAEGAGLLTIAALVLPGLAPAVYVLALLLAVRFFAWRRYLAAQRLSAPQGALAAFAAIEGRFVSIGHLAPAVLAVAATTAGLPVLAAVAGLLVVGAGAWFKYTLICRAAYSQGFALPRMPSRGRGEPGPAIRTGWNGTT
jgi:phenylacetyl-CoA:acceptor oxidoreductase subunit 2